ncbi:uncharacterized protein [Apostichopus japonicus]|uniref:uncharacterized protein isoform X2 n=1 Tax=Stichopus japonicus TaxID=307972 RepID=UPI003AB756E9
MILDNCRAAGNITFQTKKRKFVKMKLWIGCDKKNLCIGDVTLQNGASPCINGQVIEKIEPGIWAKVLALSWIYIDLGPSNLHWSTCNCDLEAAVKDMASRRCEDICPHSHSRYLRNDMPHDSDFDCLLEIAKKMYHKPGHQDVCMDVVRLLHVYVLPSVIFTRDLDIERVTAAMEEQILTILKLDKEMNTIAEERAQRKNPMLQWRRQITELLHNDTQRIIGCGEKFLKVFNKGLKRDLQYGYTELDRLNEEVELKKKEGKESSESKLMSVLQEISRAREKRCEAIKYLDRALILREEIELLLKKGLVKQHCTTLVTEVEGYMKTIEEFQTTIDEKLIELNHKKICAISVREALHRTRLELEKFEETAGLERDIRGISLSSDVFHEASLPKEWQTIQQLVTVAVREEPELQKLQQDFREEVSNLCEGRKKSASAQRPRSKVKQTKQRQSAPEQEWEDNHQERVGILRQAFQERRPGEHYQSITIQLKKKIALHFDQMLYLLTEKYLPRGMWTDQVWLCYERCIFPDLFAPYILKLYQNAYREKTCLLSDVLPKITVEDLELDKEPFVLNILGLYTGEKEEIPTQDKGIDIPHKNEEKMELSSPVREGEVLMRRRKTAPSEHRKVRRKTTFIDGLLILPPVRSNSFTANSFYYQDQLCSPSTLARNHSKNPGGDVNENEILESVDSGISGDSYTGVPRVMVPTLKRLHGSSMFLREHFEGLEVGQDAVDTLTESRDKLSGGTERTAEPKKLLKINVEQFRKLYATAISSFLEVQKTPVPMNKLVWLNKCINQIVTIAQKQAQDIHCGKQYLLSGDEGLTAVILFLIHCDTEVVANVYSHLCFLEHYIPPFFSKGEFGFTIAQFISAYQFIFTTGERCRAPEQNVSVTMWATC